jgi:hypothetical protein
MSIWKSCILLAFVCVGVAGGGDVSFWAVRGCRRGRHHRETRKTHQLLLGRLLDEEALLGGAKGLELGDDLAVLGHVGGEDAHDDDLAVLAVLGLRQPGQEVGFRLPQEREEHGAVVVLERRRVVVDDGELRGRIHLVGVVEARVVEVVAHARRQQRQLFQGRELGVHLGDVQQGVHLFLFLCFAF